MKRGFGWARALMALILFALVALVILLCLCGSLLPLGHITVAIDGDTISLSGISGWQAALVITALAVGVLLVLVVAALAVVFALGVAAIGGALGLLVAVVTLALLTSPLLLVGWLIWRLARPAPRHRAAAA